MSRVVNAESDEQLTQALREAEAGTLIIVDFSASWCGPCQMIAPEFARLSTKYPQATFIKVNADRCPTAKMAMRVEAFPTFIFCRPGNPLPEVLGRFSGANPAELEERITQCLQALSGEGGPAGGAAADNSPVPGHVSLNDMIDLKQIECLNQKDEHPVQSIFEDNDSFLESDADEQLILSFQLSAPCRIHSLAFQCTFTSETAPEASGPKTIKLFTNQQSLDFDEAESQAGVQTLTLTEEQLVSGEPVALKYVKFQSVNTLSIFVQDNQGDTETTGITALKLYGQPKDKTNMSEFKRVAGKAGEGE